MRLPSSIRAFSDAPAIAVIGKWDVAQRILLFVLNVFLSRQAREVQSPTENRRLVLTDRTKEQQCLLDPGSVLTVQLTNVDW